MKIILTLITMFWTGFTFAQDRHQIELLGHWTKEGLPLNYRDAYFNEVFGFSLGIDEYAVIGSTVGSHIIKIPGDFSPDLKEVEFVPGPQQGDFVVHRDYDVYDHYLFAVGDQEPAKLQVIDFSNLPDTAYVIYESDELFTRAHNIRIDRDNARAYVCGPAGSALLVLDISTPEAPEFILNFMAVEYVHDLYVRDNVVWLNCGGQGLFVFDMTDVNSPVLLGTLADYPDKGYNHSGWLNDAGDLYAFADENEGLRMKICDVSDLTDIQVLDLFNSEGAETAIPHNLMMKGDLIYVSHYFDGLQVFDFSNPESVERIAWYDTSDTLEVCCYGMWGVYPFLPSGKILGSDRQKGLYVFRLDLEENQSETASVNLWPNPGNGQFNLDFIDINATSFDLEVYDNRGKLLKENRYEDASGNVNWTKVDLSELPDANYLIRIKWSGGEDVVPYVKVSH